MENGKPLLLVGGIGNWQWTISNRQQAEGNGQAAGPVGEQRSTIKKHLATGNRQSPTN